MRRVAVTGLGAVTPVGNDIETMWENISAGRHGVGPITRFDCTGSKAKLAAEVKGFDPLDYMEKSEARRLDLYSQYALVAAQQAMDDSGLGGTVEPERFCIYFSSGIGGMTTFENEVEKMLAGGMRKVSPLFIPMMIPNLAAGNLAIKYNAKGSCMAIVTACATGVDSIGAAYRAIKHGYADAAITGGSEATITRICVAGFTNMTALTTSSDPDAASLPFDARRGGFVMGEGSGALILEEYGHAERRGAKIYAEITGYGSTCDAYHITAPSPVGESSSRAIRDALRDSGATDGLIYINAHGTGTPLNDAAETQAIKKAFDGDTRNVLVSSTKSMTGHMLGAAGAVEAAISALTFTKGVLPPTAGLLEPDPQCDLDYIPITARKIRPELALSVSLGFGGHNACLAFRKGA